MAAAAPPLVVLVGPTGSGKSDLALTVAERCAGELVNCDSVQIFRGFDIGAAKTPVAERRGIRHHLIDAAEPSVLFTAGDYARQARAALADITARGRLPIVVGGTGFYLRALTDGLFEGPPRDEALRARLAARQARRPGALHRLLARFDPSAARRIHANDVQKTTRALEVILAERRPLTEVLAERARDALTGYRMLKLGLNPPREALYSRLDDRATRMFAAGALENEVRALLARGVPPGAKPFESLGYAQALALVQGKLGKNEAIAATQLETRRYAKRQWTWFRRDRDVVWLDGFGPDPAIAADAIYRVESFLSAR